MYHLIYLSIFQNMVVGDSKSVSPLSIIYLTSYSLFLETIRLMYTQYKSQIITHKNNIHLLGLKFFHFSTNPLSTQ